MFIYFTPSFKNEDGTYPLIYFILLLSMMAFSSMLNSITGLSMGSFIASICDKTVGGMNILNNYFIFK